MAPDGLQSCKLVNIDLVHDTQYGLTTAVAVQKDVKGINEAKNYWQAYFDKYHYEHEVLAGAVDKEDTTAFSFWLDRVGAHLMHPYDMLHQHFMPI